MISGMSARVRAPYEPMIRSPRRTSRVISTGAVVLPGAMPTATMRPPSPMISSACVNVSGRPSTSNAMSTPRPSVSSRTRSAAFVVFELTTSVAPTRRATSSLSSLTSIAMICDAPNACAI